MADHKDYREVFQKPVKTKSKHPVVVSILTVIGLMLLGLLFPVAGLPYSVVMIDNKSKYGKLLLVFSLIGAVIWTAIMVYGWTINRNPYYRIPYI